MCRWLLLRCWDRPLDGGGPTPSEVAAQCHACGAHFVLLDITGAPYADSEGLRWLLRLRDTLEAEGKDLRIAARRGGKVWRNLDLLGADFEIFDSVRAAWKAPRINAGTSAGQRAA
jgi:anti-anti-sigma regulatory factor